MKRSEPSAGDFVVEYTEASRQRDETRVVVVRLTSEEGAEEVFRSCLAHAGRVAERLAATWALEDGTYAWRMLGADTADAILTRISTDVAPAPGIDIRSNLLHFAITGSLAMEPPAEPSSSDAS